MAKTDFPPIFVYVLGGTTRPVFATLLQQPVSINQWAGIGARLSFKVEGLNLPLHICMIDLRLIADPPWRYSEIYFVHTCAYLIVDDGSTISQDDIAKANIYGINRVIPPDLPYPALMRELSCLLEALFDDLLLEEME